MTSGTEHTLELDAVVLGAGVAGLYQLHQLREQGLRVRAYDKAGDVGGTWWWNRYPGARFDSEAYIYQYLFDEDLYKDWSWSEKFPGQPEIERWMQYVTDRLDLRRDIRFSTAITSAHYDEDRGRWTIRTDRGDVVDAQFFVSCAGMLSAPMENVFAGQDSFTGEIHHTSRWPAEVDLAGKRVGVVGIGATGIQVIQTIPDEVAHLTVFARTPQYVLPMKSPSYGPEAPRPLQAPADQRLGPIGAVGVDVDARLDDVGLAVHLLVLSRPHVRRDAAQVVERELGGLRSLQQAVRPGHGHQQRGPRVHGDRGSRPVRPSRPTIRLCSTSGIALRPTRSVARSTSPAASAWVTASGTRSWPENQADAHRCNCGTWSGRSRSSRRRRWSANRWW